METVLAPRFGQVDILRANHHGSGHSTNQGYVNTLDPDVSIISCGSNGFDHPAQTTLDRLLATGDVYLTNLCEPSRDYGASLIVDGDIVIRSSDGTNYTVDGTNYAASDPGPPSYGIADLVINELYPNAASGQTEWIELYNPTPVSIDISGAWIDDIGGGGGAAKQIPASTTITSGGYYTMDTNSFFNNGGDDARLLLPDGTTLVDSFTYTSSAKNKSWYRTPDGGAWAGSMTTNTTKGAANP